MKHSQKIIAHKASGFSLLEISIVLAVLSVVMAGILPIITENLRASRIDDTLERLDAIEQALVAYSLVNGGLPCPADNTVSLTDSNFGAQADKSGNDCTSGALDPNWQTGTVAFGGVPTRALNLPDEVAFDGWGRRYSYMVTRNNVDDTSIAAMDDGVIEVYDAASTPVERTSSGNRASYAVLSHGPNGHGGWTIGGARFDADSTSTAEQENCACDADGADVSGANDAEIVMNRPTGAGDDRFDDIVRYKTTAQFQTEALSVDPSRPGGFVITLSTPLSIPNSGTPTKISGYNFAPSGDAEYTAGMDAATGIFTVPTGLAGWYNIVGTVRMASQQTNLYADIHLDFSAGGALVAAVAKDKDDSVGLSNEGVNVVSNYFLNEGDQVSIRAHQISGSAQDVTIARMQVVRY